MKEVRSQGPEVRMPRRAALVLGGITLTAMLAPAQTNAGPALSFTAITDNIAGANDTVRIDVLRWSTDAERDQLLSAWTNPSATDAGGRGAGGRGGRGGRGGAPALPQTPESSLSAALEKAPTVGYLWSSEVAGYSIHYAVRMATQDGGERIVLITDRRLGVSNDLWKPIGVAGGAATGYEFSVVELHLNSKGEGEGKASLTGKVTADSVAKTFGLENYGASPVIFKNVKRRAR